MYKCFHRFRLSVSHSATLNLIDRVCETYDVDVVNWRDDVIDNLLISQLSVRFISVTYKYYVLE